MAWEVIFSAQSRKDLEQIVKYIARDDPAAAERFALKLVDQAESLGDAPEMGPRLPQRPDAGFFPVGSYLIISPGRESACRAHSAILACSAPETTDTLNGASSEAGVPHRYVL